MNNENVYSISKITSTIKKSIEDNENLKNIWIYGEITNLVYHSSGHIYFTLKDSKAVISVVFFKFANKNLKFKLKNGITIFAQGSITLFPPSGRYQINISKIKLDGEGDLQKQIDELRKKLLKEGIFDASRKRPLPFLPKKLGIVTSPTGAAFKDIIKVAKRRYPNMEIILAPVKVQGDDAPDSIIKGIEALNDKNLNIDIIIAGRGGGSFEDLMAFNKEKVIYAFYNSKVPIISAVGHQIDHPLSDDAADIIAPTPSAAAEIAIPEKKELQDEINYYLTRITNSIFNKMNESTSKLNSIINQRSFRTPLEIIYNREIALSQLKENIINHTTNILSNKKNSFLQTKDITLLIKNSLNSNLYKFNLALEKLEKLSPISIMKRGYLIAKNDNNKILKSMKKIKKDDNIFLQFHDGSLNCKVKSINKGDNLKNDN